MTSEELELSLRTEFEGYLNDVLSEMKQEAAEFQKKIETEFDKHKSQLEEAFRDFSSRLATEKRLDGALRESVMEHLRLARDEGAQITATAIAQAEAMEQNKPSSASLTEIRDAVNDISGQTSQSTILKSLVNHAEKYAPRGAFFIIRNEQFFGWQTFGSETGISDISARDIKFSAASNTILSKAVEALSTIESSADQYIEDANFLDALGFSHPSRLNAIPLVARGRGVAVLYADGGADRGGVNVEALETLVRIAGLTVELLASNQSAAKPQTETHETYASVQTAEPQHEYEQVPIYAAAEPAAYEAESYSPQTSSPSAEAFDRFDNYSTETYQPAEESYRPTESNEYITPVEEVVYEEPIVEHEDVQPVSTFDEASPVEYEGVDAREAEPSYAAEEPAFTEPTADEVSYSETPSAEESYSPFEEKVKAEIETDSFTEPVPDEVSVETESAQFTEPVQTEEPVALTEATDFSFRNDDAFEETRYEEPVQSEPEPAAHQDAGIDYRNGNAAAETPVVEVSTPSPMRSRLSDRQVDLPIDVSDDERRFHNDARRFARLLVSEIKLYNEQKVKDGREANDLYDRLREAIDRSREMYDKRVQPPVASKFDYFHYEIVNALADGEPARLGASYPGATV